MKVSMNTKKKLYKNQKQILELKSTVTEVKISLSTFNWRFDQAEDRMSKLKGCSGEISKRSPKKRWMQLRKETLNAYCYLIKWTSIYLPGEAGEKKERSVWRNKGKCLWNLRNEVHSQIWEGWWHPTRMDMETCHTKCSKLKGRIYSKY